MQQHLALEGLMAVHVVALTWTGTNEAVLVHWTADAVTARTALEYTRLVLGAIGLETSR